MNIPSVFTMECESVGAVLHNRRLWLLEAAGWAAWLALALAWLRIPDEAAWQVALSVLVLVLLLVAGIWLVGVPLLLFGEFHGGAAVALGEAVRRTCRRLHVLAAWAVLLGLSIWLLSLLGGWTSLRSGRIASALTLWLRRPVAPVGVAVWVTWFFSAIAWVVAFPAALPAGARLASSGLHGLASGFQAALSPRYWAGCAVIFAAAVWLPWKLVWWVPAAKVVALEAGSMGLRFLAAYLLAVTGWLVLASWAGRAGAPGSGRQAGPQPADQGGLPVA